MVVSTRQIIQSRVPVLLLKPCWYLHNHVTQTALLFKQHRRHCRVHTEMAFSLSPTGRDCPVACRANEVTVQMQVTRQCVHRVKPISSQLRTRVSAAAAAATAAGWGPLSQQLQCGNSRSVLCCSRHARSSPQAPTADHQHHEQQKLQQQPIRIAVGTTSTAAAKAVVLQLQAFGTAEMWATSAANHFTAMQALAEANMQLAGQQQGLAATASLSASDQEVVDEQKRGLKKLTLHLQLLESPVDEAAYTPSASNNLSTNRTKAVAELVQAMKVRLEQSGDTSSSTSVVIEARGEQAVTRALKALLSLQAGIEGSVQLRPWQGQVIDVVAEKRGEERLAGGLLIQASLTA